jgi:hypothetical protein
MSVNTLNYFEQPNSGSDNILNLNGTWKINGTAVTATASQLNNLEGGDAATGIIALAGGGQTGATALAAEFNNVTTVASAYDSVKLPSCSSGARYVVKNSGASILSVFPFLADSINALAVNLSVDIPVGGEMTFRGINDTVWETQELFYSSAPTTQKGGFEFKASDNAGNTDVILTNASHGQATSIVHPDSGLATTYVVHSTAALIVAEADILDGATLTTAELNRLDDSAEVETIDSGVAVSTTKFNTNLDNTTSGAGAVTLDVCPATMVGKIKTVRMAVDNGDITLALTNVQGGTAATTATFANVGEELILVGSAGGKWTVIKEFGVTLS